MRRKGSPRHQLAELWPLLLGVAGLTLLVFSVGVVAAEVSGAGATAALSDFYSFTGSRLTSAISNVGVMVLTATAAICLFAAWLIWPHDNALPWRRFLVASALVTLMLAADDYFAIHEFMDDIASPIVGDDPSRAVKNVLEMGAFVVYGIVLVVYLVGFKAQLSQTEYAILALAFGLFGLSLVIDMAPASAIARSTGLPLAAFDLLEDGAKALGIAIYATYFVRAAGQVVRETSAS
jgi:hypothetical protein